MHKEILKEDIEKVKILHDKIKSHEFRKNPHLYLLDEYAELFEDVNELVKIGEFLQGILKLLK